MIPRPRSRRASPRGLGEQRAGDADALVHRVGGDLEDVQLVGLPAGEEVSGEVAVGVEDDALEAQRLADLLGVEVNRPGIGEHPRLERRDAGDVLGVDGPNQEALRERSHESPIRCAGCRRGAVHVDRRRACRGRTAAGSRASRQQRLRRGRSRPLRSVFRAAARGRPAPPPGSRLRRGPRAARARAPRRRRRRRRTRRSAAGRPRPAVPAAPRDTA